MPYRMARSSALATPWLLAKSELNVEDHPDLREINDTFTLLGDPSALIVKPDSLI